MVKYCYKHGCLIKSPIRRLKTCDVCNKQFCKSHIGNHLCQKKEKARIGLPKELKKMIVKASSLSNQHKKLSNQIDNEMERLGYDINTIRKLDIGSYVDCIDYGVVEYIDEKLINEYKTKK